MERLIDTIKIKNTGTDCCSHTFTSPPPEAAWALPGGLINSRAGCPDGTRNQVTVCAAPAGPPTGGIIDKRPSGLWGYESQHTNVTVPCWWRFTRRPRCGSGSCRDPGPQHSSCSVGGQWEPLSRNHHFAICPLSICLWLPVKSKIIPVHCVWIEDLIFRLRTEMEPFILWHHPNMHRVCCHVSPHFSHLPISCHFYALSEAALSVWSIFCFAKLIVGSESIRSYFILQTVCLFVLFCIHLVSEVCCQQEFLGSLLFSFFLIHCKLGGLVCEAPENLLSWICPLRHKVLHSLTMTDTWLVLGSLLNSRHNITIYLLHYLWVIQPTRSRMENSLRAEEQKINNSINAKIAKIITA